MFDVNLGDRAYITLDPTMDPSVAALWNHPNGKILRFMYIDFEAGITESVTPAYSDTEVIGRAEPYKAFIGLGSKEFQLNFTFMAQVGDPQNEVVNPARFLDALKYPMYSEAQDLSYPPPVCLLKIGTLFKARVVLTGGDPLWKGPVETETLLPHACEFNATFAVVRRQQPDLSYRFDNQWL